MLDIKSLDLEKKKQLILFLWKVEFSGTRKSEMYSVDQRNIWNVVDYINEGLKIGEEVIDKALRIFEAYVPDLKTEEGQQRLGLEKRFGDYLNDPTLFEARMRHFKKTGGGEVREFVFGGKKRK
jgi:hypothetical protein